jgi:hypothetical protein
MTILLIILVVLLVYVAGGCLFAYLAGRFHWTEPALAPFLVGLWPLTLPAKGVVELARWCRQYLLFLYGRGQRHRF